MKIPLRLSFKGSREYLHGSDIFNALTEVAATIGGNPATFVERLAFRRFARQACEISMEQPEEQANIIGQARFRLPYREASQDAWLVETTIPVTGRYPFDESQLLSKSILDAEARSTRLSERSIYTPIEEVIALTKQLNYAICPQIKGQWVFGQLELQEPLMANYAELEIQMKSLIAERFSVNVILADNRSIGTIRFIVGAP